MKKNKSRKLVVKKSVAKKKTGAICLDGKYSKDDIVPFGPVSTKKKNKK